MRDEQAEAVREFYRRAGRLQLAEKLRERMEAEIKTYRHPYTTYENYPGYVSVLEMLIEEMESDSGVQ